MRRISGIGVYILAGIGIVASGYNLYQPSRHVSAVTCCNFGVDCGDQLCCEPGPGEANCSPDKPDYCTDRKQCI